MVGKSRIEDIGRNAGQRLRQSIVIDEYVPVDSKTHWLEEGNSYEMKLKKANVKTTLGFMPSTQWNELLNNAQIVDSTDNMDRITVIA